MTSSARRFKFSGMIAPEDHLHQVTQARTAAVAPDEHTIAPVTVTVEIRHPVQKSIGVPQYSATVVGGPAGKYDPAGDCDGNYMSYKFQPNNNCYAYGCNITPNTFPQPGRHSGYLLTKEDFQQPFAQLGEVVAGYAAHDGLVQVGSTMDELKAFKTSRGPMLDGHFVALMISPAGDQNWPGDYHWARCDNSDGACDSWSQKDGGDQVTNFDFAGRPISDPATANWTVNQGPISKDDPRELVVDYAFYCFMFVPAKSVTII